MSFFFGNTLIKQGKQHKTGCFQSKVMHIHPKMRTKQRTRPLVDNNHTRLCSHYQNNIKLPNDWVLLQSPIIIIIVVIVTVIIIIIICFIIIKITIKVTFLCLNCSRRVVNYSSTMYATPLKAIEKNLSTLDFVTSPSLFYQLEILFPIGLVLDFEHLLLILVEFINEKFNALTLLI